MPCFDPIPPPAVTNPVFYAPATDDDARRMRNEIEVRRFVESFVRTGTIVGVMADLGRAEGYVRTMLRNAHIRSMIRNEADAALHVANITPQRMLISLWRRFEQASDRDAVKLAEMIFKFMGYIKGPCDADDGPRAPDRIETALRVVYEVHDADAVSETMEEVVEAMDNG